MVYGGIDTVRYIVEANGCGVAFLILTMMAGRTSFCLNGWRLEGFAEGKEPINHLYRNNRDGTFTDITRKAGLVHSGWANGICVGDYDNDGYDDLFLTYSGKQRPLSQQRQTVHF